MSTEKCARPTCDRSPNTGTGGYCQVHAYALGTLTPFQPADEAKHIIDNLVAQGMTYYQISKQAGIGQSTLSRIVNGTGRRGEAARVRKSTLDALRTVNPRPEYVPAWPSSRRIRSLRAAGKGTHELAAGLGVDAATIRNLTNDVHPTTHTDLAERIRAYYDHHQLDPVTPAHHLVRDEGWPLPMEWDDIDDPTERYDRLTREETDVRAPLTEAHIDALQTLMRIYTTPEIGRALGIHGQIARRLKSDEVGRTVTAELLRRIEHLATRRGVWEQQQQVAA